MNEKSFDLSRNSPVFRDGLGDDPEDLDTYDNGRLIKAETLENVQEAKSHAVERTYKEIFQTLSEAENAQNEPKLEEDKEYAETGISSLTKPDGMAKKDYKSFFADSGEDNGIKTATSNDAEKPLFDLKNEETTKP